MLRLLSLQSLCCTTPLFPELGLGTVEHRGAEVSEMEGQGYDVWLLSGAVCPTENVSQGDIIKESRSIWCKQQGEARRDPVWWAGVSLPWRRRGRRTELSRQSSCVVLK